MNLPDKAGGQIAKHTKNEQRLASLDLRHEGHEQNPIEAADGHQQEVGQTREADLFAGQPPEEQPHTTEEVNQEREAAAECQEETEVAGVVVVKVQGEIPRALCCGRSSGDCSRDDGNSQFLVIRKVEWRKRNQPAAEIRCGRFDKNRYCVGAPLRWKFRKEQPVGGFATKWKCEAAGRECRP